MFFLQSRFSSLTDFNLLIHWPFPKEANLKPFNRTIKQVHGLYSRNELPRGLFLVHYA